MWVRTTHDGALILKYLDPYVLLTKFGKFFYPSTGKYNKAAEAQEITNIKSSVFCSQTWCPRILFEHINLWQWA